MKTLATILFLLVTATAFAGNTSNVYTNNGAYAGRVVQQPGSNTASVYGPTGAYMGRIVQQPNGQQIVYGSTGAYEGTIQAQPGDIQTDGR